MAKKRKLISINHETDIPPEIQDTPVSDLLRFHNFKKPFKQYLSAQLLIIMCMDNRKQLVIPDNFAYVLRTAGGNTRNIEFMVSYAIAIGKIKQVIIIGHDDCGMVNLNTKKDSFVQGLVEIGKWTKDEAEEYFEKNSAQFEINNEIDFTIKESERFMDRYKGVTVIPAIYRLEDNLISLIKK